MKYSLSISASCLALGFVAATASASDRDFYLSAPSVGAIVRLDADTLVATNWATPMLIPHYGTFMPDGYLYMPDRGWPAMMKIDPNGQVAPLSAGGLFEMPVTCIPARDGSGFIMSDMKGNKLIHVAMDGTQTLLVDDAMSNDLLDWPDGLAYDADGNLYVANLNGNTIIKYDAQWNASLFSASPLIDQPGGLVIDGSGNMFCAMYNGNRIVRFRLDTAEAELFAEQPGVLVHPSDLKLSRDGALLTCGRNGGVFSIDATGQVTTIYQDFALGELVGIAVPQDAVPCSGTFKSYGASMVGSGGFEPQLRGLFSPCPGAAAALEFRDFLGGAPTVLFLGTQKGSVPLAGGTLLIDLNSPWVVVPFTMPGAGAGAGDFVLPFTVPDNANLSGIEFDYHAVQADPAGPQGAVFSNGLCEIIGT